MSSMPKSGAMWSRTEELSARRAASIPIWLKRVFRYRHEMELNLEGTDSSRVKMLFVIPVSESGEGNFFKFGMNQRLNVLVLSLPVPFVLIGEGNRCLGRN